MTIYHRGEHEAPLPQTVRHVHGTFAGSNRTWRLLSLDVDVVVDMVPYTVDDVGRIALFAGSVPRAVVVCPRMYLACGRLVGTERGPYVPTPPTEDSRIRSVVVDAGYDKVGVEREAAAIDRLTTTIVRLPAVHGPGDGQHRLYSYIRRMVDGRSRIVLDETVSGWRWTRLRRGHGAGDRTGGDEPHAAGRVYNVAYEHVLTEPEWVRDRARAR